MQRRTNLARAVRAALVLPFTSISLLLSAQGLNDLWVGGFGEEWGQPWGGIDLDFTSWTLSVTTMDRDVDYFRTTANMTDAIGSLLLATNGVVVANALSDTMPNGDGLNPSPYVDLYPQGSHIPQGALVLPKPGTSGIFYLFHSTVDNLATFDTEHLYLTTVDMSLDGGMGAVVSKNVALITDQLNIGKITAVRHANGRDWWVFCHQKGTTVYYRLLVTPEGVLGPEQQAIGVPRLDGSGQVCFSPDGSKFAHYWGQSGEDLDIFDFDRCTGLFSNPVNVVIEDEDNMGGVAFSPNGRYLYVSSTLDVYQFDTEAADIAGSMVHIAEWDGFHSPSPPFATLFDIAQLAPDGKIYISTGNGTLHLHVIHNPDEPGLACNMEQHGIELPRYFMNSLPNHPNYHLGPVVGSVCDSLDLGTGMAAQQVLLGVQAYPNPSNGAFTVSYAAQPEAGELEVRDLSGRVVYQSRLAAWSQVHTVVLRGIATGMYQCRVSWGAQRAAVRVMIEP